MRGNASKVKPVVSEAGLMLPRENSLPKVGHLRILFFLKMYLVIYLKGRASTWAPDTQIEFQAPVFNLAPLWLLQGPAKLTSKWELSCFSSSKRDQQSGIVGKAITCDTGTP